MPLALRVDYDRKNAFIRDYIKNISRGGTFIQTSQPLAVGTRFCFSLHIPDWPVALEFEGEVRWVMPPDRATLDQPAGMGVQFIFGSHAERAQMEATVRTIVRDALGEGFARDLFGPEDENLNR